MVAIPAPMVGNPFLNNQTIVIAEAQSLARKPIEIHLTQLGAAVHRCKTKPQLLELCDRLKPDLLLLGTLPQTNSLDLFRQYRDFWQKTPVILLAHQPVVNDYFRDWAMKQGVSDVVSSYPQNLALLQTAIKEILFPILELSQPLGKVIPLQPHLKQAPAELNHSVSAPLSISRQQAAIALNKISEFSKKYFGNLAIGNYWRKTKDYLQKDYPLLAQWTVDHWGTFTEPGDRPEPSPQTLSTEEIESLKTWVLIFTKECERIVVDFPQLLHQYSISNTDFQFLL